MNRPLTFSTEVFPPGYATGQAWVALATTPARLQPTFQVCGLKCRRSVRSPQDDGALACMSLHVNNRGTKGIRYPAVIRASVARSLRLFCNLPWTAPNCLRRKAWWASRSWRSYAAMRGIVRSTSRNNRLLRVPATNFPKHPIQMTCAARNSPSHALHAISSGS
jgi:hypothetical protein